MFKRRRGALVVAGALGFALAGCGSAVSVSEGAAATHEQVVDTASVKGTQGADDAQTIVVASDQDITIDEAGTYALSGLAHNATVVVDVDKAEEVTLVLVGLEVVNDDFPVIYVRSADKVRVLSAAGTESALSVTGQFVSDGDTATDAVIFAKDDLVLDGEGTLLIKSTKHGVVSKDDLKVKGGAIVVTASSDALSANDTLTVEGGTVSAQTSEGLEATVVSIEGGQVNLQATDDGINATLKSDKDLGTPTISISGGETSISMAQGDTDALDANGDIIVSGGTLTIRAQFAFDFDGTASLAGGTVVVNGEQVDTITNSMMGGGFARQGIGGRGL